MFEAIVAEKICANWNVELDATISSTTEANLRKNDEFLAKCRTIRRTILLLEWIYETSIYELFLKDLHLRI